MKLASFEAETHGVEGIERMPASLRVQGSEAL